jgi:hypothetical protein
VKWLSSVYSKSPVLASFIIGHNAGQVVNTFLCLCILVFLSEVAVLYGNLSCILAPKQQSPLASLSLALYKLERQNTPPHVLSLLGLEPAHGFSKFNAVLRFHQELLTYGKLYKLQFQYKRSYAIILEGFSHSS